MPSLFTAHNILLDDGTLTMPAITGLLCDTPLLQFARSFLPLIFPGGFEGLRLVDLGCLEGGYAVEFARLGFETLGIEVRAENFQNCQLVKNGTNLPNLIFACDDVRNLGEYGTFDVVFCCGLLYHLDCPRRFIDLVSRCCRRLLILDTHVASEHSESSFHLSESAEHEGLTGRWYSEADPERDQAANKWAAWNNPRSFWPDQPALVHALQQAGFPIVLECPFPDPWRQSTSRITLLGLKP